MFDHFQPLLIHYNRIARFSTISRASPVAYTITSRATGRFIEVNQAFVDLVGYEPGEAIGMNVQQFPAAESREIILRNIRDGNQEPYEVVGVRKDGTTLPIEVQARLFTYQGRSVRVAAIRDITSYKRAEEALRMSEQRFRSLIRDLQVGVLLQGPGAEIILSNQAALDLLGLTEDQLPGLRRSAVWRSLRRVRASIESS